MEFSTLQAQIRASRQTTAQADGATFTLELPSAYRWTLAVETNRNAAGQVIFTRTTHEVLSSAIIGWSGLTERHLLPQAPADSLPFSTEARAELLECRQDIADDLIAQIGVKLAARNEATESARKNS